MLLSTLEQSRLFTSFKHKVGGENNRFIFTTFASFKVSLPVIKRSVLTTWKAPCLLNKRSDILSIYSVRARFNLTVWCTVCRVLWLTVAGWKTPGKCWRFKWSFAMTTGAWCMLINRWGRKRTLVEGGWGGKNASDRNLSDVRLGDIKKSRFASPHKSPNRMWYMQQKVWLEKSSIWYKGEEIGTFLNTVWQPARFVFFDKGGERRRG